MSNYFCMKQAYLIIAHNNFEHLKALINTLDCNEIFFYLHIDAKAEIPDFIRNIRCANPMVILRNRSVGWGSQSIVLAEMDLFAKAFENTDIEWFHLISGNDFPVRKTDILNRFFEEAEDVDCFMETEPLPEHLRDRMELYHYIVKRPTQRKNMLKYLHSKFLSLQCRLGVKRQHPVGLPFMYGSSWVDLRRSAVDILLRRREDIIRFTRHTSCSDEVYKQTVLQNCGLRIVNDNLRYIDWSARQPSPKTLRLEDYDSIIASGKLFARKFDSAKSAALRQRILRESLNLKHL